MFPEAAAAARLIAGVLTSLLVTGAVAQDYPSKPVRIIVPFPPGGPTDIAGRIIANGVGQKIGKPFLVENRPGGGTLIATEAAAQSAPDGHTLLLATSSLPQFPILIKDYTANLVERLAPISYTAFTPLVVMSHTSIPAKNLKEFVDYVRANPGKLNYGNSTVGGPQIVHLFLNKKFGLRIAEVNYQGTAQAQPAFIRGDIQMHIGFPAVWMPLVNQGHLRFIAALSDRRIASLPDLPTIAEQGVEELKGMTISWYGVMAPAGTPKSIISAMSQWISEAARSEAGVVQFAKIGTEVVGSTPEEFAQRLAAETKQWAMLAKEVNFVPK